VGKEELRMERPNRGNVLKGRGWPFSRVHSQKDPVKKNKKKKR